MSPRAHLSEEDELSERSDRDLLRRLEGRLDTLVRRRHELIDEVRRLSAEQKALYDQRQGPQAEVERLYDAHGRLGKRLGELRSLRDKARQQLEQVVIARRELLLTLGPAAPVRPEQIRREIAELELRQQTRALPLDEENALIARLRQRSHDLQEAEAHAAQIQEHALKRKSADAKVLEARGAVQRIVEEMDATRVERERTMAEVRSRLAQAGGVVAEMRARGRARADVMAQVDAVGREIAEVEREGREVFHRLRSRRDEARRTLRSFAPPRERAPADLVASTADRRFEELMKRGKINLGG